MCWCIPTSQWDIENCIFCWIWSYNFQLIIFLENRSRLSFCTVQKYNYRSTWFIVWTYHYHELHRPKNWTLILLLQKTDWFGIVVILQRSITFFFMVDLSFFFCCTFHLFVLLDSLKQYTWLANKLSCAWYTMLTYWQVYSNNITFDRQKMGHI